MKKIIYCLLILFYFTSCELDNYDAPNIQLIGKVVYNERPIYVRNNQVTFRLYEMGWELTSSTYMDVQVSWDGSFSSAVYGGKTYKLIRQPNIGPWVEPTLNDTITINNYNGQAIDMPVVPYYLPDNVEIQCKNRLVTGSCTVTEITQGKTIEKVGLYVGRNIIVDDVYNLGEGGYAEKTTEITPNQTVSLNVDLSGFSINSTPNSLPQSGFAYARMGIKITGIDAMIFTEPIKITFSK